MMHEDYKKYVIPTIQFHKDCAVPTLVVLDQRTIVPGCDLQYGHLSSFEHVCTAIQNMMVRGAPLIGIVALYGAYFGLKEGLPKEQVYACLMQTRPTAINLRNALDLLIKEDPLTPEFVLAQAESLQQREFEHSIAMGQHGADWFQQLTATTKQPVNILTHCNAGSLATYGTGTALAVIRELHMRGHKVKVYCDETRPRKQGILTYWELSKHGIECVYQTDTQAALQMRLGKVGAVIYGADRITKDGYVFNKIGSSAVAIVANYYGIPTMVVAPSTTRDLCIMAQLDLAKVIEQRPPDEVLPLHADYKVDNYGFDVTDPILISAYVTEHGAFHTWTPACYGNL